MNEKEGFAEDFGERNERDSPCLDWQKWFPYPRIREIQRRSLETISEVPRAILELPTGTGKTAIGFTFLKALEKAGVRGALLYVTPTKTLVDQTKRLHPEVRIIYGQNEYPCLYYGEKGKEARVDEVACSLMTSCPHKVISLDALPEKPCPYYLAKAEAERGGIVACTTAFYLVSKLFTGWPREIAGLVLDEVHRTAQMARALFKYDITDYHLERVIELITGIDKRQAENIQAFLDKLREISQLKPARKPTLLEPHEIEELRSYLKKISLEEAKEKISAAVRTGEIDPVRYQEELKLLETIGRDLKRYIDSFRYAMDTEKRNPLNYIFAYYEKRIPKNRRVKFRLGVRANYVAPLIRKSLEDAKRVLGYSATIGDPEIFGVETGIDFPFWTFPSPFPTANARIFLPVDTPNLALKSRGRLDLHKSLKMITEAAGKFREKEYRSLVIVESEEERRKFLGISKKIGLEALSYGEGAKPREITERFINGEGDILVGTAANYSHGIDLPKKIAPVIFFFRPGYPKPGDPATQFEEKRFGKERWKLWAWRVTIEALQVRGRNIRSATDIGVTFLISKQFGKFLPGGLPEWLQGAWNSGKPMEEQVKETIGFLNLF